MSSSKADRNLNTVSLIVGIPLAIVLFIWAGWITVTAFVGGQVARPSAKPRSEWG